MRMTKLLAWLLLFALLSGCISKPIIDEGEDLPQPPGGEDVLPEPEPDETIVAPEPMPLPVLDGIDWNKAPIQGKGTGDRAVDTSLPKISYIVSDYYTFETILVDQSQDGPLSALSVHRVTLLNLRNMILQNRLNDLISKQCDELSLFEPQLDKEELQKIHGNRLLRQLQQRFYNLF